MTNIIEKLKKSKLTGKSGSGFPTGLKWETVKKEKVKKKYIICNASEGEPQVKKDGYILQNFPEEVINGIKIALKTLGKGTTAYIYLRKDYYQKFGPKLKKLIGKFPIKLSKKTGPYIGGEETAICNAIEEKRPEPRLKPPFPTQKGLFGCPTLINNVETFYYVSQIAKGKYKKTRFYSIEGDIENKGVFELPADWTIEKVLKETKNYPDFDFFVKSGGGAVGEILLKKDFKKPLSGAGSLIIFNRKKTNIFSLLKEWIDFFHEGNCDKCVPCREGVFRLKELIEQKKIDKKTMDDLFFVLSETSFCALGKGVFTSIHSAIKKLIK